MRCTSDSVIPDVNGQEVRVGESLPHGEWKTIEAVRGEVGTELYARIHDACAQRLGAGTDPDTGENRRNMQLHRRLCLACVSPVIEQFTAAMKHESVKDINQWVTKYNGHGASAFMAATRAGLEYAI
ncbi:MAG: hypothetical protein Q9184_004019 [Pyrenodesmia sp. 2 TL-2023]